MPGIISNKMPALENTTMSAVVAENLNVLHTARRVYIQAESSEKIGRALRHQVRPSIAAAYHFC